MPRYLALRITSGLLRIVGLLVVIAALFITLFGYTNIVNEPTNGDAFTRAMRMTAGGWMLVVGPILLLQGLVLMLVGQLAGVFIATSQNSAATAESTAKLVTYFDQLSAPHRPH